MKKLIPAICMLLVAASLLGTSTYAWFSMNTSVSATGMQITANSDSVYLLIDTKEAYDARETERTGLSGIQDDASNHLSVSQSGDNNLLPAAWKVHTTPVKDGSGNNLGLTDVSGTSGVGTKIATATNWYKAEAANVTASDAATNKGTALTGFSGYVKIYNYKLTLAKGSNEVAADKLKVTYAPTMTNVKTGASKTMTAVRVLVVCGDRYEEFSSIHTTGSVTLNAAAITDAACTDVTVYVYYDGNDSTVFTNNAANLEGAIFNLTFSVE